MGGTQNTCTAIPKTIQQLTLSRGEKTQLNHFSLQELDNFIGNHNGVLAQGKNFSKSSHNITAQLIDSDIKIECLAKKPDGKAYPASLLLGQVLTKEQIQKIR